MRGARKSLNNHHHTEAYIAASNRARTGVKGLVGLNTTRNTTTAQGHRETAFLYFTSLLYIFFLGCCSLIVLEILWHAI